MEHTKESGRLGSNRQKGFTLLEVIMAVSILTVGILAVASMQGAAIMGNVRATDVTDATTLATDRLEKLAALAYDDTDLEDRDNDGASGLNDTGFDNNPATSADSDYETNELTARGKSYSVYWNVAVDYAKPGTKTVNVIVAWRDHGREKHISLRHIKPHL